MVSDGFLAQGLLREGLTAARGGEGASEWDFSRSVIVPHGDGNEGTRVYADRIDGRGGDYGTSCCLCHTEFSSIPGAGDAG